MTQEAGFMGGLHRLWGMGDWPEFQEYQRRGGGLGYEAWKREGKPQAQALTPRAAEILERTGGLPTGVTVAREPTPEEITPATRVEVQRGLRALEEPPEPAFPAPTPAMTYEEATEMQERLGEGYYIDYDEDIGGYRVERDPRFFEPEPREAPITPWQEEQIRLAEEEERRARQAATEASKQQAWQRGQEQERATEAAKQQAWERQWSQQQVDIQQQQWQQQFGWQQEQAGMQQAEAERQERARLAAQPISWLQYAAYTGEQPAVQPWMQPLMPQQYQQLGAGAAIPGFEAGGETMAGLPQLTTPSAQLWGRMGPTAQQQFAGYKQARTGQRPEETQWRRQQAAPPGGRFGGLRWSR